MYIVHCTCMVRFLVSLSKHETMRISLVLCLYLCFQWKRSKNSLIHIWNITPKHQKMMNCKKYSTSICISNIFISFESKLRAILFIYTWSVHALIQNYAREPIPLNDGYGEQFFLPLSLFLSVFISSEKFLF